MIGCDGKQVFVKHRGEMYRLHVYGLQNDRTGAFSL